MRSSGSILVGFLVVSSISLAGCGSLSKKDDPDSEQLADLRTMMLAMNTRMESMENKVSSMNDKVDSTRSSVENLVNAQKPNSAAVTTPVQPHPAENIGAAVEPTRAPGDPDSGYVNDSGVKAFRQGMMLFQAKKYPEAILGFSSFLERYSDHALAGSAQFYVGESYFRQGEFRLAVKEYQRVLTSYDRSSHVADTLKQMALAEDQLKQTQDAAKHRQLLSSLFPQSPAAAQVLAGVPGKGLKEVPVVEKEQAPAIEDPDETPAANPVPDKVPAPKIQSQATPFLDEPPATAPVPSANQGGSE